MDRNGWLVEIQEKVLWKIYNFRLFHGSHPLMSWMTTGRFPYDAEKMGVPQ